MCEIVVLRGNMPIFVNYNNVGSAFTDLSRNEGSANYPTSD
jgi:hypothetical protein